MGNSLSNITPGLTFQSLLKIGDNSQLTSTLKTLSDGNGNDLPIQASTTGFNITGTLVKNSRNIDIPSLTSTQRDAIATPYNGYLIYNSTVGYYEYFDSFWGWMPIFASNEWKSTYGYEYWNDLGQNNNTGDGVIVSFTANGGLASITSNPTGNLVNRIGYQGLRTGTASNGRATIMSDPQTSRFIQLTGGKVVFETAVYIQSLSDAIDRYLVYAGLGGNITAGTQSDGLAFLYDEGGNSTGSSASGNWQIQTANASIRTYFTTSIPVVAATWYKFKIEVNENATQVNYYINDTIVRTETTNIPGSTRTIVPIINIIKIAGTNERSINVDYIGIKKKFTTPR